MNMFEISAATSLKIRQLSLFLSFLVVCIHSYTYYYNVESIQWIFQKAISDNIGRVAVPVFYLISGFFLFLKYENTFSNYKTLISKKLRSLVVPYFLWSIISFLLMYCIQFVYTDFNQELIRDRSLIDNLLSILYGENTVLWFVRILFFMNLLSPIIKVVIDKVSIYIPVLIILILIDLTNKNIGNFFFNTNSLLFFLLGGVLSKHSYILEKKLNYKILLLLSVFFMIGNIYRDFGTENDINTATSFEALFIFVFSLFLWSWDALYKFMDLIPLKYYKYSFTIYLFHAQIMVITIKKIFTNIIPAPIIVYVITIITTFGLSLLISLLLDKYFPKLYKLLSGSR